MARRLSEEYPEHEKVRAVAEKSQAIGEFLDNGGYELCTYETCDAPLWIDRYTGERSRAFAPNAVQNPEWFPDGYYPVRGSIDEILARYFGVDLAALEAEKRDMLERLRATR